MPAVMRYENAGLLRRLNHIEALVADVYRPSVNVYDSNMRRPPKWIALRVRVLLTHTHDPPYPSVCPDLIRSSQIIIKSKRHLFLHPSPSLGLRIRRTMKRPAFRGCPWPWAPFETLARSSLLRPSHPPLTR